ncbi:MAG TPA: Ig-like domain-containing protein [Methylomirabilota bacterium]|nr:Ig-like domain-containing protein [Methylomirabilota bacterium]
MRRARSSRRALAALLLAAPLVAAPAAWATQATAIFPSDRFTLPDPAQLTGRRVALAMPSCPTDPSGCDDVTLLNELDGFSVNPRVAITFDAPIKVESVTRENAFVMPLAPEPGAGPIGLGQLVWDPEGKVLYARPERVLLQGRIYALVVTTQVQDAEGKRLRPAPDFLKPREGTGHDRKVETQMWKALAPTRLKWADIAGIALFTTQSVTADLERMRAVLESRAPPALTFDLAPGGAASVYARAVLQGIEFRRQVATSGMLLGDPIPLALNLLPAAEVRTIAFGRYRSPSFLTAERNMPQAPTRRPLAPPTVEEEIHVTLFLPEGSRPAGGWPVAIFGHGFTNDRHVITPAVAGTLARNGIATIAINVVGHGAGHDGTLTVMPAGAPRVTLPSGGRGLDLNDDGQIGLSEGVGTRVGSPLQPITSRDGLKQTVADLMQLVRAIRRGTDVDGDGQPDLDRERIYYVGQSFGGMYGTLLVAVEPRIRAAVLNVPGGPVIEIARQAAAFRPSVITGLQSRNPSLLNGEKDFVEAIPLPGEAPMKAPPAGALDIQDYFDRIEWLNQAANPVAFAPYLVRAPLGGGAARPVLYQWAVGDRTVPNPTTESLLRGGDLFRLSSLYRHDQVAASLPERFRANPHGFLTWTFFPDVADIARAAQEQAARFLLSDGQRMEQVDARFELAPSRP